MDTEPTNVPGEPLDHDAGTLTNDYSFTADWFSHNIPVWTALIDEIPTVSKILEIGSYEGRSTVWLIDNAFKATGKGEVFCIDTWEGGPEQQGADMAAVEERFIRNLAIAKAKAEADISVQLFKGSSFDQLASLIALGHGLSFDIIYVDGSHQCPDVLSDLVLSFQLCKVGGLIICDDYLWRPGNHGEENLLDQPKLAIDSFVNCYARKLLLYNTPLYQLHIKKTSV